MAKHPPFKLKLVTVKGAPVVRSRAVPRMPVVKPVLSARTIASRLKTTPGADAVLSKLPKLTEWSLWNLIATFSACGKTGTAQWLDLWDADHFDGVTDMGRCLADCRAWFSANGYTFWDSAETKTGRVNCHFRAPSSGPYTCDVQLQSFGGPALVECLIDSSSFGFLPVNGLVVQPHVSNLPAGGHSFRIRQVSGSFFFHSLTVWKV